MANKYIRHGETYCGDGTTSAAATSNGGVGSWNNINVFEGSAPAYGTAPAAGDTVYIRSKDNGGANITRTASGVYLGSTSATGVAPITWIIDGGATWSGVNGVVTYSSNSSGGSAVLADNHVVAEVQDALVFAETNTYPAVRFVAVYGYVCNAKFESADVLSGLAGVVIASPSPPAHKPGVVENGHFVFAKCTAGRIGVDTSNAGSGGLLVNPNIEINSNASGQYLFAMRGEYGASYMDVIGGRISGVGASSVTTLTYFTGSGHGHHFRAIGLDVPRSMPISSYGLSNGARAELFALDAGIGAHIEEYWGWATSRTDNNPPTLSAQLPSSTTPPWAWRVYPRAANYASPAKLHFTKLYTAAAAAKDITLEMLVATTMSPNARLCWMTVEYVDNATGLLKHLSTLDRAGGALASSTASWSFTTWGMISFVKRKLTISTPTAVKQDTPVIVTWWFALASGSDQDILFLDPDFALS